MADRLFEWGPTGARQLAPVVDVLIVVDVLSFSTSVDVAVARGAAVYPARWKDERAAELARDLGAELAVGRSAADVAHPYSLSPASLASIPPQTRLVLPSPNGATISAESVGAGATVLAGCLRNVQAVASAATKMGTTIGVVAAGERWPDGSLRPALEDAAGAGAILDALGGIPSPDAAAAIGLSRGVTQGQLTECPSSQELLALGFGRDVELALMRDVSQTAPILHDGAFRQS